MKNLIFQAPANFSVTTSNQKMLDRNRSRRFLEIINTHATAKAYLAYGSHAAVVGKGTVLMPNGGVVTFTEEYMRSIEQINVIGDGSLTLAIQEAY